VDGYFPTGQGATWNYRVTTEGRPSPIITTVTVGESRTVRGFQALALKETDPDAGTTVRHVAKHAQGLVDLGTGGAYDPVYVDAPFPMVPGTVASGRCTGASLGEDLDGDGKPETFDLASESVVLGLEDVQARLGTVPSAAHVRTRLVVTLRASTSPLTPVTLEMVKDAWYAKQVGLVRQDDGTTASDLLGYGVEGIRRGLVDVMTVPAVPQPTWRLEPLRGGPPRALLLGKTTTASGEALQGRFIDAGGDVGPAFGIFSEFEDGGQGYRYQGLAVGGGQVLVVGGRTRGYGYDVIAQRVTGAASRWTVPAGPSSRAATTRPATGPGWSPPRMERTSSSPGPASTPWKGRGSGRRGSPPTAWSERRSASPRSRTARSSSPRPPSMASTTGWCSAWATP
jgi:hypothetical protein